MGHRETPGGMSYLNLAVAADHHACALTGLVTARTERLPGALKRRPVMAFPVYPLSVLLVDARCICIGNSAGGEETNYDGREIEEIGDGDFELFV